MEAALWIILSLVAGAAVILVLRKRSQRTVSQRRLASVRLAGGARSTEVVSGVPEGGVARWLYLAGHRAPKAPATFWSLTLGFGLLGGMLGVAVQMTGWLDLLRENLEAIPGQVGMIFVPVVAAIPALLPLTFAALPTVRVRRARRRRAQLLLRDLYPALELFASLAQAGLAFDAALNRVLTTFGTNRPLGRELQTFQTEVLGGGDRSTCFRRLAQRVELPQMSSFTAALIRAHEVGIGLANTLRRQADELRTELRERSLAQAQSLPSRLVFPLVICFLPGIFVMTLGPAFYGFLVGTAGFGSTR
ncbi:MAG: type II secretion system F family protein [Planctomycetota bacterium]|nr:type II secretion system F family protein [Planctomycetota bacterium]